MFKKETSSNYPHIVCNIGRNRRVILCKDGLQWIIQSSDGENGAAAASRVSNHHHQAHR